MFTLQGNAVAKAAANTKMRREHFMREIRRALGEDRKGRLPA
jgi:hypothetical protein